MEKIHEYYAQKRRERIMNTEAVFPADYKKERRWVVYKVFRSAVDKKKKKVLINVNTGSWASSTDSSTWVDFETAKKWALSKNGEGLSFALLGSGITCIDVDGCIDDDGNLSELAQKILTLTNGSLAEKSVSRKGIHVFMKGNFMDGYKVRADGGLEVFDNKFISLTGDVISSSTEIKEPSDELIKFLQSAVGEKVDEQDGSYKSKYKGSSDEVVFKKISRSRCADEFSTLYQGNVGFNGDHSKSDFRLIGILVYFTDGDEEQTKRLFMKSGLYRPEKGDKYIDLTIKKAVRTTHFRIR